MFRRVISVLINKSVLQRFSACLLTMMAWWCLATPNIDLMQQLAQQRYGNEAVETIAAWRQMVLDNQDSQATETLRTINVFFNQRIRFSDDQYTWQQADYWATPLETMGRRQGDCEDFSIAKYVSLLLAGIPAEQLRMVYVKVRIGSLSKNLTQAHMVVAYYPSSNADPLILDNLNPQILPASQRRDLLPVFSFNSAGLWIRGQNKPVGSAEKRLSRWRNLLTRMQAEGL